MFTSPQCHQTRSQIKDGLTEAGRQRVRCRACGTRYTPLPKPQGYPDDVRTLALKLYVDGLNFRRIARILGAHHHSVINWVNAAAAATPDSVPIPSTAETVELDELYTFGRAEKNRVYVVTAVDRTTHTFVVWAVVPERDPGTLQAVVDPAPQAQAYYSDGFAMYRDLVYGDARYTAMPNKSQTYIQRGGWERRSATLCGTLRAQIALFPGAPARGQTVCVVLQPTSTLEAALSQLSEAHQRFYTSMTLDTPRYLST